MLAWVGLVAFLLLGLLAPILGPALPWLSEQYGLRATGAAMLLSLNSAGAFLGVLVAGFVSARLPAAQTSLIAVTLLAVGCLGLAYAPTFTLALLFALVLGFGFGMLDLTLNVWIAASYGSGSAAALNLLSATFGVGAVLAPLVVGLAGGRLRLPLLGCLALAVIVLALLSALRQHHAAPHGVAQQAPPSAPQDRAAWRVLAAFVVLFLTYVAAESGVGAWEVTHLTETLDMGTARAAQLSALFWVCFTLGRLISAPLALRMPAPRLIAGSLVLAALSLGLATFPAVAPAAYALTGLFFAPVFTTGLVWLTASLPIKAAPTVVFAGAFLGPTAFSPVIGAMRDTFGPQAIPLTIMGIALLCLGVALRLSRQLRP